MQVVLDHLDVFVRAMGYTISLALLSFTGAMVLGLIIAGFRVSPVMPLRAVGTAYIETIRNIPPLALLVLFYFGFPNIGIAYSEFVSAVIVMSVYTGAFIGEAVRSGINTVAKGQAEAARALGLTFGQSFRIVILPQALRSVVPAIGSLFSALVRNVSLASVIAVPELAFATSRLIADTARPFAIFGGTTVAYLAITLPTGYLIGRIEKRTAIKR